jgi:integrase
MARPPETLVKLTNRIAADAVCPQTRERISLHDATVAGLELRVTRAGGKSWVVRYFTNGKQSRLTLGRWPELTCDDARKLARSALGEVAGGKDPAKEKREARQALTLTALVTEYLAQRTPEKVRMSRLADKKHLTAFVDVHGPKVATQVTRADVAGYLATLDPDKPSLRRKALAIIGAVFTWGERQGLLPVGHTSPTKGIPKPPEKPRKRHLSGPELQRLVDALNDESEAVRVFFMALIYTGCRRSELSSAKWSDLLDSASGGKVIHLAETKNGEARNVPIPAPLWAMIKVLPRVGESPYIWPAETKPDKPMNPDSFWPRIRRNAELSGVHIHDIRATVATRLAIAGHSEMAIQAVLGHRSTIAARVYVRDAQTLAQDALAAHAESLAAVMPTGGEAPA